MKLNRTHYLILISSLALLVLLIMQVNWIYKTARVKEDLFNETARLVLSHTADALSKDSLTYRSIEATSGKEGKRKVDSLFHHYMELYHIHIDYYVELRKLSSSSQATVTSPVNSPYTPNAYATCIAPGEIKGTEDYTGPLELKLIFPDREQFLAQEMGVPFLSSVLLILVVMIISWRTTLSLMKENELATRTSDFLNNMTHEFKTPLTNISLAGKMILKEPNSNQPEKVKHYTGIILHENAKLRQQVDHMLSVAALERGEVPLQKNDTDVHGLVREAVNCMSVQIENRQGQLRQNLKATNSVILGDRQHLTNAICGLIDNAVKYSERPPDIEINTYDENGSLVLELRDKGIGIDESFHKQVFDKYFRVPTGNVHDVKGFGLGLTYLKTIVEMHHGTITLQSKLGEGTCFKIIFPHE